MAVVKKFAKKHSYFFGFLSFLLIYDFVIVRIRPWGASDIIYSHYLVDFSMGFCSKFLSGTIYNFFFNDTSVKAVYSYCLVLFILFLIVVALLLEKLMLRFEGRNKNIPLLFIILFISGPLSISALCYGLGLFDFYWLFIAGLSLACISKKQLYFLVIPLSLIAVTVNYGYLTSLFPFVVLLMMYKTTILTDQKEKRLLWIVCITTMALALGLGIYFLLFECDNLVYTKEKFVDIVNSRGFVGNPFYFTSMLYNEDAYDVLVNDTSGLFTEEYPSLLYDGLKIILHRFYIAIQYTPYRNALLPIILSAPVIALIFTHFKSMNNSKSTKTILYCIWSMFFGTLFVNLLLSIDIVRFIDEAYIGLLGSYLYMLYLDNGKNLIFIEDNIKKISPKMIVLYLVCYTFTFVSLV